MKRVALAAVLASVLAAIPQAAAAHGLGAPGSAPESVPGWTWDVWITAPLALAAVSFAVGWWRLRSRAAAGRRQLGRRAAVFAAGWLVLAGALVSPLHQLGARSFAAHMFEHELLMLAAAPLLVLARPLAIGLWAFPRGARRALGVFAADRSVSELWRGAVSPLFATLAQASALWLWHVPALFDRALASEVWHAAQHASFLLAGLLFWTAMLTQRTPGGVAVLCLFATSVVSGALGALMAFAASPWYPGYAQLGLAPLGLTPTEDQQLAGLLMWVPGGLVHACAALLVLHRMLGTDERGAHAT